MVKRLFFATVMAVSPLMMLAQGLITGSVKDARSGETLIGASVIVKNEKNSQLRLGFIIAFILFSIWSFYLLAHTSYFKMTFMLYDSVLF